MIIPGLSIFAGLSLNLMLQLAIGSNLAGRGDKLPLFQLLYLFITVVFLWLIYSIISNFLPWEFLAYFLFFPVSVLGAMGFEYLEGRLFPKKNKTRLFSSLTAYEGLIPASLILTVKLGTGFLDALGLSFFFAFGCLLALVFIKEIRRRASLEEVPSRFRDKPLVFISLGLLSMVFGAAAMILYRVLDSF